MEQIPDTMTAVVFDGPHNISVQQLPTPKIQDSGDIIVKVQAAGLCGSDLHLLRGLEKTETTGFIMDHEFTGTVVAVGKSVKTVSVGDKIVSPFTVSCGECFYCKNGFSSRCIHCKVFGTEGLPGAQAQFVRVPRADGTVIKAPPEISDDALILMADLFPTGFFGTKNGFAGLGTQHPSDAVVVVIGCGPVGLSAIVSALEYKPKHLFAIDAVESRLRVAKYLGAEPLNVADGHENIVKRIGEVTEGRGADVVVEAVGLSPALRTAYDIVRPFGSISSIGVHNSSMPFTATEGYGKNVKIQMGRCPVRSIFPEALAVLAKAQHRFGFMFEKLMPLSEAVDCYALFSEMQVQKVIFKPWQRAERDLNTHL
ncbi:chaperonin 10-like protein [Corynascus novoguineensis]|uniref:Chaperonin 10-like protein n=1 Tax=Corynascus novoguineensis TaxID=1126955 RepID=A0AAN7HKE5_9PEZI|nr:chaperonin 10-like protein [Corynascus novoguineensis]